MATKARFTQRVREYLDSQGLKYRVTEKEEVDIIEYRMNVKGNLSNVTVYISIRDNRAQCFAVAPLKAKPETYANVVEYLTRANYNLVTGGFEFDYSDGEIRYRDVLWARDDPSLGDIELIVDIPVLMMQRYGDGLVKNMMGYGNPEEDVKAAESNVR
ncbi:MAG: YbjN domain-containing protein [Oscillospiraceae bacterium]|nr:YbjN domain-containing protein [Oscillospiraceae bacterium]